MPGTRGQQKCSSGNCSCSSGLTSGLTEANSLGPWRWSENFIWCRSGIQPPDYEVLYYEEWLLLCFPTVERWEWIKVHLSFITAWRRVSRPGGGVEGAIAAIANWKQNILYQCKLKDSKWTCPDTLHIHSSCWLWCYLWKLAKHHFLRYNKVIWEVVECD